MTGAVLAEVLGWVGFAALIASYLGFTTGRLSRLHFHGINLVGGVSLAVNAGAHGSWPLVALNVVYSVIAAVGLWTSRA